MKKTYLTFGLAAILALSLSNQAHAYSSATGPDPKNATSNSGQEIETKLVVKSAASGSSQAIVAGDVLGYDQTAKDGYTVTKAITQDQRGLKTLACVALEPIATGDTQYHPCITKGFVNIPVDGTANPLEAGRPACVNGFGRVRGCNLSVALEATANTGIIPLNSTGGTDSSFPVILHLR